MEMPAWLGAERASRGISGRYGFLMYLHYTTKVLLLSYLWLSWTPRWGQGPVWGRGRGARENTVP